MNGPTLATLLSSFFLRYLAVERGVSPHTIASYRDSVKMLLRFSAARYGRSVDQLAVEELTAPLVLDFLADLETRRLNTIRTRNAEARRCPNLLSLCRWARASAGGSMQSCFGDSRQKGDPPSSGLPERAGTWAPAGASRSFA